MPAPIPSNVAVDPHDAIPWGHTVQILDLAQPGDEPANKPLELTHGVLVLFRVLFEPLPVVVLLEP
jgi:hypothetical protein